MFSRSVLALSTFVALVSASALDVFSPPILTPAASTVWTAGAVETVTWDAAGAPAVISNGAEVVLKKDGADIATLASGFDLRTGSVDVTVPAGLATGDEYSIVLFGTSGNVSPTFDIVAA